MSKLLKKQARRDWPYLLMILFVAALLWSEILHQPYVGGLDSYFHMNSFYEDAMQLKTGHFSYFLSAFGFNRSGRIVNALYGPGINYFAAGLLLLCGNWARFSLVTSFLVMLVGGMGMYHLDVAMHVRQIDALVLALAYVMGHWFLVAWVGNGEFTGLESALMPFVILAGCRILLDRRVRVVPLAVLMAILLQIHLMTSIIATLALLFFFVGGWLKSTHRWRMLLDGIGAAALAGLLSGNVWSAVWDVMSSNQLLPTFPQFNLQAYGSRLVSLGTLTLILLAIVIIDSIIEFRKVNWSSRLILLIGLIFLWLSSTHFPWNFLTRKWQMLASLIQFPQRFLPVFSVIFNLVLGLLVTRWSRNKTFHRIPAAGMDLLLLLLVATALRPAFNYTNWLTRVWYRPVVVRYYNHFHYNLHNANQIRRAFRSPDLKLGVSAIEKGTSDYLPLPHRFVLRDFGDYPFHRAMNRQLIDNHFQPQKRLAHGSLILTWWNRDSVGHWQVLPLVKYRHTKLWANGRLIHPHLTLIGAVKYHDRPGFNRLVTRYQPGIIFELMSIAMPLTWLILLIVEMIRCFWPRLWMKIWVNLD